MTITTPLSPRSVSGIGPTRTQRWKHTTEQTTAKVVPSEPKDVRNAMVVRDKSETHWLSLDSVNEFFYGFRYVIVSQDGKEMWDQVPLTLDDVLYPQLEDKILQSCKHSDLGTLLLEVIRNHVQKQPGMYALWDVGMNWRVPGLRNPVPDILILMGVKHPPKDDIGVYDRAKYGGVAALAIELTSQSTRYLDVNEDDAERSKCLLYEQLGVLYFIVIDTVRQVPNKPLSFWGYELVHGKYQRMIPDNDERLWIPPVGVSLGQYQQSVAWFDANGNRLLTLAEQEQRTEQEKMRADEEKARADAAEEELRQLRAKIEARG